MRYWVLVSDKVLGPYPPEELAVLPAFGAESEVCPEERRGDRVEDWQQASKCAELFDVLDRRSGGTATAEPLRRAISSDEASAEAVLRKFAEHGSVLHELETAKKMISLLRDELRDKDVEMAALKRQASDQALSAFTSREKTAAAESRLAEVDALVKRLDQALADKKAAETASEMQQVLLAELKDKVSALQKNDGLAAKIDELRQSSARLEQDLAKSAAELAGLREAAARTAALEAELKDKTGQLAAEKARSEARHGLVASLSAELERLKGQSARPSGSRPPPPPVKP